MLWVKVFYIIVMVCWFVGIFYLLCLFVYYVVCEDEFGWECFKIMECKLYWGIIIFLMVVILVFGFWLISYNLFGYFSQGWLYVKLVLVVLLVVYYFYCGYLVWVFWDDCNICSYVFYCWFNEILVFVLLVVVILVVVRLFQFFQILQRSYVIKCYI